MSKMPFRVSPPQAEKKTKRTIASSPKSKKTRLSVTFPDGTCIERNFAYETFLDIIERVGASSVARLNIRWVGLPLVSKEKDDFYNQHEISGGWYVVTHSATITKRQQLEKISKELGLNLKIEII
jgi:hypothetical protein